MIIYNIYILYDVRVLQEIRSPKLVWKISHRDIFTIDTCHIIHLRVL